MWHSMKLATSFVAIVTVLIGNVALASVVSSQENDNNTVNHATSTLNDLSDNLLNGTDEKWLENEGFTDPLAALSLSRDMHKDASTASHSIEEKPLMDPDTTVKNITALDNFDGTLPKSFIDRINPHWLYYPPQSTSAHYILAFIYFIMMILGLTGNFLVIYIFITRSSVRTPANNLVVNLAISDFLIMLEAPIFIYNSIHFGPASGEFMCKLYGLMGGAGGSVAIMTLCAISVDRYNVIVFPLNPSRSTTNNRSRLMILFVWLYSFPFFSLPFFEIWGVKGYAPEGFLTACSFDYLDTSSSNYWFIFCYAIAAYFVPITIIAYCYFHILHVVLSAKKIQSSKEKNKQEVKLAAIVLGIIGLWLFAWTPYCIVSLLGILGYGDSISPLASMIPAMMAKIAACGDPYLYAVSHPRFRAELEKMFCSGRGEGGANNTSRGGKLERTQSECETIQMGPDENEKKRRTLQHSESSVCSEVSDVAETQQ